MSDGRRFTRARVMEDLDQLDLFTTAREEKSVGLRSLMERFLSWGEVAFADKHVEEAGYHRLAESMRTAIQW